ncbi:Protein FAM98A [Orchesella cincta]|uniref:Protein FAM98A n=1 Tax=Orchesella cincta TaxID=48709 RepID=A0A1D2MLI9_ORCCI|nr:Protein FAM98A [Orchesella cincta]
MQLDQMDHLIMEALADLNKAPTNMERTELDVIINDWAQYSELVSWAASELQAVAQTEEVVQPVKSAEDLPDFQMEFSGLLKELGCPYSSIMEQSLGSRFDAPEKKKIMLNFLLSELQAARITYVHKPKQLKVELDESSTAKILREVIMELGLGKPPETITVAALWNNINGKVTNLLKTTGTLDPLFEGFLSPAQWSQIEKYFGELTADYQKRQEMLLKRLDVTVQSFHWSDRLKGHKEKEINQQFQKHRPQLNSTPSVKVCDILAARADLPIVEKTASASVRKNTKSAVNNVVIGRVPDRGGRTDEIQPPPPEMPPWQQRQGGAPPGTSGWIQGGQQPRGGGGRGGGGGRVQGGWSDSGQRGGGGGGGGNRSCFKCGLEGHISKDCNGSGGGARQQSDNRGGGGGYNNKQQYDNRGGGAYNNQQYDNRSGGGYNQQQQQYDNRGGGGYEQQQQSYGGGGYYQHDNRSGGGYQDNRGGGGGGYEQDQQQGRRGDYRGGRGGNRGGGGRRY